jgi:hypothetical protein
VGYYLFVGLFVEAKAAEAKSKKRVTDLRQ